MTHRVALREPLRSLVLCLVPSGYLLALGVLFVSLGGFGWPGLLAGLAGLAVLVFALIRLLAPAEAVAPVDPEEAASEHTVEDPRLTALWAFEKAARHDLHEPLRKIASFGERLEIKYGDQLDETGQHYVSRMVDAASRMRALIDDLLTYSRTLSQDVSLQDVDLDALMQTVADDLAGPAGEAGAEIIWQDLPRVRGDAACLHILLLNLVGNAVKFRREDVAPRVEVRASTDRIDGVDMHVLEVADNGIGFDPRHADRIFELFERLHPRGAFGGGGMGLALCRAIVERHSGRLSASGQPGNGAIFKFTLPRDGENLS